MRTPCKLHRLALPQQLVGSYSLLLQWYTARHILIQNHSPIDTVVALKNGTTAAGRSPCFKLTKPMPDIRANPARTTVAWYPSCL